MNGSAPNSRTGWKARIFRLARPLAWTYAALLAVVFIGQRSLIYHPAKAPEPALLALAPSRGLEPWRNAAGELIGWKHPGATNGPNRRALIMHGNAGCAVDRGFYANALQQAGGFEVFVLEYPGFGARGGSPSETSLRRAADEALKLLSREGPVFVLGESLGTGVAAYLAGAYPNSVSGVLLLAPYHHLAEVGQYQLRIFPVSLLLFDRFSSARHLENYHGPLGVLVGGRDVIVPSRFGQELYDAYQGPKKLWEVPLGEHDAGAYQSLKWWQEAVAFLQTPGAKR